MIRELRTSNLLVTLPCPVGRTFQLAARFGRQPRDIELAPVAYRDDLALSLWGTTNHELLEKIIRASTIVQKVHSLYHLTVNFAASKTEVAVALKRPDAKAHWQGMRLVGQARGSHRPMLALSESLSLTVASTYPHLGCIHAQSLDLRGEVSQMLARSRAALTDKRAVLANKRLTKKSRLGVHCTYIRGHLLQNVAVLQPFPVGLLAKLEAEYQKGLRVCTDQVVAFAEDRKMTTKAIMMQHHLPHLSVLMERRTLGSLLRLLVSDNPLVMASLAADASSRSSWQRVFQALNNLRAAKPDLLGHLPRAAIDEMDPWIEFIVLHAREWPSILKSYHGIPVESDDPRDDVRVGSDAGYDWQGQHPEENDIGVAAADPEMPEPAVPVAPAFVPEPVGAQSDVIAVSDDDDLRPLTELVAPPAVQQPVEHPVPPRFHCDLCEFTSASYRGLQSHKRRAHNVHTPLSLRVAAPNCGACNLNFGTRARILDHFRTSPRCATWVLANVDPMTPTTFARVLREARAVDETHSRVVLPKAGRKPAGDRPPQCGHTAIFADELQRIASEH
eukprot:6491093-Amphidinium_carterae.1